MGILGRLMAAIRGTEYLGNAQAFLDECANMDEHRCSRYTLYEEYYNGERGAVLRDRAIEYLERNGIPFCENFAEPVVDALAERLKVIGFQSTAATTTKADDGTEVNSDPVGEVVESWWSESRMDGQQGVVHTQALIKADDFVIVEWSQTLGRPVVTRQRTHQVRAFYSDESVDTIEYASKVWNTSTVSAVNPNGRRVQRLNVYFPDHVEKWFRPHTGTAGKGGWGKWQDPDDAAWPTPWVDAEGQPLGVAVIHFRNKPLGDDRGRSRVRPTIAFQDQLNKYVADLNDLVDNHALPQDWATGVAPTTSLTRVPGDVWTATDSAATFGRLAAGDTANVLNVIEAILSRLARRSRVPMHLLTGGTPPSGEALKTSESGLVATAVDCQTQFGNSWEDAMMLAVRLGLAFGDDETKAKLATTPEQGTLRLETQWANPEIRSDADDLQVAEAKKRLGVSSHTLLGELGYDAEKEAELKATEAKAAADAQGALFDAGGLPV